MQYDGQFGKVVKDIQKRNVTVLKRGFENAVEISDGLVIVQRQNQSNLATHA